jgi:hypothetical protein
MSDEKDNIIEMPAIPQEAIDAVNDPGISPEQMERKRKYAEEKLAKRNARELKAKQQKLQHEAGLPVTRGEFVAIIAKLSKSQETVASHEVLFSYLFDSGIIKDEDLKVWIAAKEEHIKKQEQEQLAKQIAEVEAHRTAPLSEETPTQSDLVN